MGRGRRGTDAAQRGWFMRWLHAPLKRWHAVVLTVVFGPLALVFTLAGWVMLVVAPPAGVLLLFSSLGGWFVVVFAWRMVGADPVTMERPKDGLRRAKRSPASLTVEDVPVGADTPQAAAAWRATAARIGTGQPQAPAVHLVFRVEPTSRARLERLVVPVLAGLRDAGVLRPEGGSEVVVAERVVDAERPGVGIKLLPISAALQMQPPGPVEHTVSLATPPASDTASERASAVADAFADLTVRDHRSLEMLLPHAVASATTESVGWLRVHRTDHAPVALAGAVGNATKPSPAAPPVASATPRLYACPAPQRHTLAVPPRLASWDAKDAPSQQRLRDYLDHVAKLVALHEHPDDAPLALLLDVGLGREIDLDHRGHDLDNYLFPVAQRLGANRLVLARATKHPGTGSTVAVGPAEPADVVVDANWETATVTTSSSASTSAWKQEVIAQLAAQVSGTPEARLLAVELAFTVGPGRNWANLWKPAIDSIGHILGVPDPTHPFAPRDDLIISLGLHRTANPTMGNNVRIDAWWRNVDRAS